MHSLGEAEEENKQFLVDQSYLEAFYLLKYPRKHESSGKLSEERGASYEWQSPANLRLISNLGNERKSF